jgi:hypothetical protein
MFYHMSQLEDKCQRKTHKELGSCESNEPMLPAYHKNRYDDVKDDEKQLAYPEEDMVFQWHSVYRSRIYLPGEILYVVHEEHEK